MRIACTNRGAFSSMGGESQDFSAITNSPILSDLSTAAWTPSAAAADLHGRLRYIGDRVQSADPLTVCIFLDGENAWEYFPGNGRDFLRQFYKRIESDQDFRALTASEAIAAAKNIPTNVGIFPGSWINANFDVWIGDAEDVTAWELLWDARQVYAGGVDARCERPRRRSDRNRTSSKHLNPCSPRREAIGAGGTARSTAPRTTPNSMRCFASISREFIWRSGKSRRPDLAKPIKRKPEHAVQMAPTGLLKTTVDGRDTSYFEWLGAGLVFAGAARRRDARSDLLSCASCVTDLRTIGSASASIPFMEALCEMENPEFRITIGGAEELTVVVKLERGHLRSSRSKAGNVCLLNPKKDRRGGI